MDNTVNALGEGNFFDDLQDIKSEIHQLESLSLGDEDRDRSLGLQLVDSSVLTGDLAALDCLPPVLAGSISVPELSDRLICADAVLSELPVGIDELPAGSSTPDVSTELDLLLVSLQLATPQAPQRSAADTNNCITNIRSQISTVEPVTHTQQLIQELIDTRQQLASAQVQLQLLHRRNQAQVDRVDTNTLEVKQIKFHTQQLAQYSRGQVETVRDLLDKFDRIRMEIVASLDKFGGYEQLRELLVRLETNSQKLVPRDPAIDLLRESIAADRAAFEVSLQKLQREVVSCDRDTAAKLRQYQESIERLAQTIATDRVQTVEINTKFSEIDSLGDRLTTMHDRVVEKSQTLQSQISQIERSFVELSQSIQSEKEQFYALTVETIEKADLLRSHLMQIANQSDDNQANISQLQTDIASIHEFIPAQIDRQLDSALNVRDRELLAIYHDLQARQHKGFATIKKLSTWLWILSIAVGTISILSIWVVVIFKKAAMF